MAVKRKKSHMVEGREVTGGEFRGEGSCDDRRSVKQKGRKEQSQGHTMGE